MCDSAALIEHQARFSALQRAENSSMQRIVDINNTRTVSVLFSEPKIPQSINVTGNLTKPKTFQCSSASRKFLNRRWPVDRFFARCVSVLFSEPKIPQSVPGRSAGRATRRFSALQRAENSSITTSAVLWTPPPCFSALQRAENSSIRRRRPDSKNAPRFQCSSASRKFLNCANCCRGRCRLRVSVLFSEPKIPQSLARVAPWRTVRVSVLFSEPKIPQL